VKLAFNHSLTWANQNLHSLPSIIKSCAIWEKARKILVEHWTLNHRGRVLAPVIGRYGGASSDLSLILDLFAREMARKHTAFYNIGFSEAKALFRRKLARKWGHAIARGRATLLLDRLRDFVVIPSSAGENSSFELHSQSMEECATLDRYHHFHGHSGMCA
jgi:hypothetical protein